MKATSAKERISKRAAFIAGLMVRLLVAALFVRIAFWFVMTFVAAKSDFSYITHGSMAAIAVLYVLGFIGFRIERTVRNDLTDAQTADSYEPPSSSPSPFAKS